MTTSSGDARLDLGRYSHIVVGAGSAGCVLANRLSADPKNTVLLLEAGGSDRYHWIHIPVGYLHCMGNPRTDWGYATEEEAGLNGRKLAYPRGRVMGGCSSINGMIYMRGQAADYDGWRQLGNVGWGWDDVLPLFRRSENHHALDTPFHSQSANCVSRSSACPGRSSTRSARRPRRSACRRSTTSTPVTISARPISR